jgi:hypothetical protein
VPEPTTVWMVHLAEGVAPVDVRGTLEADTEELRFTSDSGEGFALAYVSVRRAKRLRMSPVLLVSWDRGEGVRQTAFYFAPPPPIEPMLRSASDEIRRSGGFAPLTRPSRRRQRRKNSVYLSTAVGELRPVVVEWADEVRRGVDRAKGR